MKKTLALLLAALTALSLLSGCNKAAPESGQAPQKTAPLDVSEIRTLGDAMAFESEGSAWDDKTYVYAFEADGVYYRVTASLPPDVSKAMNEIDFFDEQREEKYRELFSTVEISKLENLSEQIPAQEELDKLVGKTGQELLDDGWKPWACYLDTMEFYMYHGLFDFVVVFDGKLEMTDDFNEEEDIKPLTVKSVTFRGLGDAADLEEPDDAELVEEADGAETVEEANGADAVEAE